MPSYEEIKEQIKLLPNRYIFYTKREVKYLPNIMIEGELIRGITSGYYNKKTILAVCTNRRVIFLDKGMFFGMRQWQLALDRIQSIDGSYMILFGKIRVWDGAAPIQMDMVWAKSIDPFIKSVREAIDEFRRISFQEVTGARTQQPAQQQIIQRASVVDVAEQLEKLIKLKDAGHLTEDEFQQQRRKILG